MAEYNGWTNYETWNLALWIGNEEGTYNYWREQTREAYRNARGESEQSRMTVATKSLMAQLRQEIEEANPLAGQCSFYADIMGAAISEVNCWEIAENWLDDLDAEEKAELAETDAN